MTRDWRRAGVSAASIAVRMRIESNRGVPVVERFIQDMRFACRVLMRDRGFALTAILVLGVGLGVNNMFFTLVYAHKFRGVDDRQASNG